MFICGRSEQNQLFWSQNGVNMSPYNRGVFRLMKKVTWSLHCNVLIVLFHKALQASSNACEYR